MEFDKSYDKECTVCGKPFKTHYKRQNVCSFECKMKKNRARSRHRGVDVRKIQEKHKQIKNYENKIEAIKGEITELKQSNKCIICGYFDTVDIHHEGGKEYVLCPNHHAIVTRGILTLQELLTHNSQGEDKNGG